MKHFTTTDCRNNIRVIFRVNVQGCLVERSSREHLFQLKIEGSNPASVKFDNNNTKLSSIGLMNNMRGKDWLIQTSNSAHSLRSNLPYLARENTSQPTGLQAHYLNLSCYEPADKSQLNVTLSFLEHKVVPPIRIT